MTRMNRFCFCSQYCTLARVPPNVTPTKTAPPQARNFTEMWLAENAVGHVFFSCAQFATPNGYPFLPERAVWRCRLTTITFRTHHQRALHLQVVDQSPNWFILVICVKYWTFTHRTTSFNALQLSIWNKWSWSWVNLCRVIAYVFK